MGREEGKPSLKAILFADLVQYSRLVGLRETDTLDLVQNCFQVFRQQCDEFGGVLVKTTGDGAVVAFDSASDAVKYAVASHAAIDELQANRPKKARFRMGVHLGEVRHVDGDIYGHAVNVAARLEPLAPTGGICISHDVYVHARRGTPFQFTARGPKTLKNIPEPVTVYNVLPTTRAQEEVDERFLLRVVDGLSLHTPSHRQLPLRSRTARALIGYLALSRRFSESPDRLAMLLFPGRGPEQARRALSQSMRAARTALQTVAPHALERTGDTINLQENSAEIDLHRLYENLSTGEIDDMLVDRPDWPDAILFGLDNVSTLFRSWLQVTRHNWRTKVLEALEACIVRFDVVEPALRRAATGLLRLEPSHERAAQQLIRHHVATGNSALAIQIFDEFRALLAERYQLSPDPETLALVDQIRQRRDPAPAPTPRAPVEQPAIGLGRFEATGGAADTAHIVSGFRSDLLANLSRFRQWVVLELENGSEADRPRPDYRLTATSRPSPAGVELFVTLTDDATRAVVWSEGFPVSLDNWLDAQRHVVQRIAAYLEVYLSTDRLSRAIAPADTAAKPYDDWLQGEHLLTFWTPETEDQAAALFERVIAERPDFAPAYASLAGIHNVRHLIQPGLPVDAEADRRALSLARRAAELDPLDARNHQVVGWAAAMAGQFEQSSLHYELAVSLNPNSPKSLLSCAQGLAFIGAKDRARELLDQAIELSPALLDHQWCYIASTRYMLGDYEGTVQAADRGNNATLDNPGWRAAALAHLGQLDEARRSFEEQVEILRTGWRGEQPITKERVLEWFMASFPIGRDEDRDRLHEAFEMVTPC